MIKKMKMPSFKKSTPQPSTTTSTLTVNTMANTTPIPAAGSITYSTTANTAAVYNGSGQWVNIGQGPYYGPSTSTSAPVTSMPTDILETKVSICFKDEKAKLLHALTSDEKLDVNITQFSITMDGPDQSILLSLSIHPSSHHLFSLLKTKQFHIKFTSGIKTLKTETLYEIVSIQKYKESSASTNIFSSSYQSMMPPALYVDGHIEMIVSLLSTNTISS